MPSFAPFCAKLTTLLLCSTVVILIVQDLCNLLKATQDLEVLHLSSVSLSKSIMSSVVGHISALRELRELDIECSKERGLSEGFFNVLISDFCSSRLLVGKPRIVLPDTTDGYVIKNTLARKW
jgi:hypothetical protein